METLDEVERLFTEGVREAGERAAESVTRMNEENIQDSDKVYSGGEINSRTFAYNELVAKGDLMGIVIDKNRQVPLGVDGNIDKNALLAIVKTSANPWR